jgi:ribosomal protein S18 acetylase RimI-like enzyme
MLQASSGPDVLEALDRHEREVSAAFARALRAYVDDRPDRLVYVTGLPASFANGVKAPRLAEADVDETIQRVSGLLRSAGVPGTWVLTDLSRPEDLGERLERAGIPQSFELPILTADMDRLGLDREDPAALEIRRVANVDDHRRWLFAMEVGFDMPNGHTRTIDQTALAVGFDADAKWVRFVGTTTNTVVASSGLMLFGGVAGVYNVATVPEARRRGFGAAMTRAALRYARDRGYRVAILGTSPMGRGVYERMGFRDVAVERHHVYEPSA